MSGEDFGFGKSNKKGDADTGNLSPVAQSMVDAVTYGPSGYDPAILANLGLDVPNAGTDGGGRTRTGMTANMGETFGAQPVTPQADPLAAILPPKGEGSPVTANQLYLNYKRSDPGAEPEPEAPKNPFANLLENFKGLMGGGGDNSWWGA